MYFEDIYNKIRPLWKETFSLEGIEETESYIEDINPMASLMPPLPHESFRVVLKHKESKLYEVKTKIKRKVTPPLVRDYIAFLLRINVPVEK